MGTQLLLIVLTAIVTSAVTLAAAWWLYERHLRQRLLDAVDAKAAELGEMLESHVRAGVRQGVRESVASLPSDVIRTTGRGLTETGVGMLEDGINTILGTPRRRRDK